jgi:hypothetical protein
MADDTKIVEVPGVGNVEFPADMPDAAVGVALRKQYAPMPGSDTPTQAEQVKRFPRLREGALGVFRGLGIPTEPETPPSLGESIVRGVEAGFPIINTTRALASIPGTMVRGVKAAVGPGPVEEQRAGQIGEAVGTAFGTALPFLIPAGREALPPIARASGAVLEKAGASIAKPSVGRAVGSGAGYMAGHWPGLIFGRELGPTVMGPLGRALQRMGSNISGLGIVDQPTPKIPAPFRGSGVPAALPPREPILTPPPYRGFVPKRISLAEGAVQPEEKPTNPNIVVTQPSGKEHRFSNTQRTRNWVQKP